MPDIYRVILVERISVEETAELFDLKPENARSRPEKISGRVGNTIVRINNDNFTHTATARDKSWDVDILSKNIGTFVVKEAAPSNIIAPTALT